MNHRENYFLKKIIMENSIIKHATIPWTPMKILLEEYKFSFGGIVVVVPAWYAYDGLSIPQAFQWVVNMNHSQNQAAWLEHDFLYSKFGLLISDKEEADVHLRKQLFTYLINRYIVYLWVKIWWHKAYWKDSNYILYKEEIQKYRLQLWFNISIS